MRPVSAQKTASSGTSPVKAHTSDICRDTQATTPARLCLHAAGHPTQPNPARENQSRRTASAALRSSRVLSAACSASQTTNKGPAGHSASAPPAQTASREAVHINPHVRACFPILKACALQTQRSRSRCTKSTFPKHSRQLSAQSLPDWHRLRILTFCR